MSNQVTAYKSKSGKLYATLKELKEGSEDERNMEAMASTRKACKPYSMYSTHMFPRAESMRTLYEELKEIYDE